MKISSKLINQIAAKQICISTFKGTFFNIQQNNKSTFYINKEQHVKKFKTIYIIQIQITNLKQQTIQQIYQLLLSFQYCLIPLLFLHVTCMNRQLLSKQLINSIIKQANKILPINLSDIMANKYISKQLDKFYYINILPNNQCTHLILPSSLPPYTSVISQLKISYTIQQIYTYF
ncbi:hypothetical protein ABPG74_014852 [Tetrahymena malaccensis]